MSRKEKIASWLFVAPTFLLCAVERGILFALCFYVAGTAIYYLVLKLIEWDYNRSGR